jgi:tRNA(fMet)-specific endonuclease VapC
MYMLDTNILIFAMRHPDTPCAYTVASHAGNDICISVITYAELEYGIQNSRNPDRNRNAVNRMLAGIPILPFDISAGKHFGDVLAKSKGINGQDRDKMIAAHCRSLGYTLVTDNTRDFQYIDGLNVITWRTPGDT